MGMCRLVLDLPTACPPRELLDIAATELTERGTRGWTNLELRTTGPTGTALIRHVTFTYWIQSITTVHPQQISYHSLWAHLEDTDRTALLKLTDHGTVSLSVTRLLTHKAGRSFFVRDAAGDHRLPTSFRIFLRTMASVDLVRPNSLCDLSSRLSTLRSRQV
ncbi:hypothetical protein [Rhodococcus sp. USK10]|uniref:hypothetical protein n=1 Tax=Rhodococcus sp. USK10 TaxID=2789739 RepID=UPI002150DE36|nr:hypothetical protein [Rhodococcus sp. USK10]